jgi:hypothetical protein
LSIGRATVSALTSFCEAKMPDFAASFLQRAEKCRQNEDAATCARDKADWITLDDMMLPLWVKLKSWWQTRAMRAAYRRLFQRGRPRKGAF